VKRVLLASLGVLTVATVILHRTLPAQRSAVPVITWVTDDDQVRHDTVALFGRWLAENRLPPVDLRIDLRDNTPTGPSKALIQGVSGVADDLTDVYMNQLEPFQKAGILLDVTDIARARGFGAALTYPAVRSDLEVMGRQYGFPRAVDSALLWVNRATFARYGIAEPPSRWNWDQFEEIGLRFVAAANPPGSRQRVFFLNRVWLPLLRRGLGLSTFNETMTRCTLDDPRNVEVLRRAYRWTVTDRLLPTQAEQYALVSDATGFDSSFSLFASGRFAMIYEGLWALIRLHPRGEFQLRVVEPFTGGFPNVEVGSGAVCVYAGSPHPELACLFLQFLASRPFNLLVARSGDSMPPLPSYARTDDFLHPPHHPGEAGVQEFFADTTRDCGIAASRSPFILPNEVFRIDREEFEEVLAGRASPEEGARVAAARINAGIELNLAAEPGLRRLYRERCDVQERIAERRAAGRPVPANWISDPFHLAYYRARGWLDKGGVP